MFQISFPIEVFSLNICEAIIGAGLQESQIRGKERILRNFDYLADCKILPDMVLEDSSSGIDHLNALVVLNFIGFLTLSILKDVLDC